MAMTCRMSLRYTAPGGANCFLSLPTLEGGQTHLDPNKLEVAFKAEQIFASPAIVQALDEFGRFVVAVKGNKNVHLAYENGT